MDEQISPELVLQAYCQGVFPMGDEHGQIGWFSPDPRCILEFDRFNVSRSLRQVIRRAEFEIRVNTAFDRVIRDCADRPEGTWISADIIALYTHLHHAGFAHSLEAWRGDELAGGLYGIAIGGAFFGESMFHHLTDASKVALVALMNRLQTRGYALVDTQWTTPHLLRFGATEIPRDQYLQRLHRAIELNCTFTDAPPPPAP